MPRVSVIMPSLNVVNYIEQAIESVVNQTLEDIEIICVDAGSDDGTIDIIERFAQHDSRIRLIISDKKSYGYQMNLGINNSSGEYIGIVETDDYIKSDMYETLYGVAKNNNLDFVKSDYEKFWWDEKNSIYAKTAPNDAAYNVILTDEIREDFFRYSSLNWTGMYRREYLIDNDIWHSETPGASYQDIGFWLLNMSFAKRAMWIPKAFYMYRQDNPASSMKSRGKMLCSLEEYRRVLNILQKRGCSDAYRECLVLKHMDYKVTFSRIDDSLKKEYLETIGDEYAMDKSVIANYNLSPAEDNSIKWLEKILDNPDKECDELSDAVRLVRERLDECSRIYLYGAGLVAQRCFERLYSAGYWENVKAVVVSGDTYGEDEKFFGRSIYPIERLISEEDSSDADLFILGLGIKNQEEVLSLLRQYGVKNIMLPADLDKVVYVL